MLSKWKHQQLQLCRQEFRWILCVIVRDGSYENNSVNSSQREEKELTNLLPQGASSSQRPFTPILLKYSNNFWMFGGEVCKYGRSGKESTETMRRHMIVKMKNVSLKIWVGRLATTSINTKSTCQVLRIASISFPQSNSL